MGAAETSERRMDLARIGGIGISLLVPLVVHAQFKIPPAPQGLPTEELPVLIARVIQAALLLVGVIALLFIVYGGFRYIYSRGDEQEIETAKRTIIYAVIGIVVIGLGYAIVEFVFRAIGGGGGPGGGNI